MLLPRVGSSLFTEESNKHDVSSCHPGDGKIIFSDRNSGREGVTPCCLNMQHEEMNEPLSQFKV